jgi:hypothetical protein
MIQPDGVPAADEAPRDEAGRFSKAADQRDNVTPDAVRGTGAAYVIARLKRDHPNIIEKVLKGEFKSVQAAAREAGIKVPKPPPSSLWWTITSEPSWTPSRQRWKPSRPATPKHRFLVRSKAPPAPPHRDVLEAPDHRCRPGRQRASCPRRSNPPPGLRAAGCAPTPPARRPQPSTDGAELHSPFAALGEQWSGLFQRFQTLRQILDLDRRALLA